MKATFTTRNCKFTSSHRKEKSGLHSVFIAVTPAGKTPVELRIYYPGQSNCYACLWTRDGTPEHSRHGSGVAGGYGYHKPSAAAQEAITNAGIDLDTPIDGVGTEAIKTAITAICAAMNIETIHIIHTYP